MTGGDWRDRAVCRDVDPELFFPIGTGPGAVLESKVAKAVCARCPVRGECLAFALEWLPEGIAGGLTPSERRGLSRGRRHARVADHAVRAERSVDAFLRQELRSQARSLRRSGESAALISVRLGVSERQVERWLAVAG